eukprot:COSAG05_NODE_4262_length_1592_cov_504.841929_3_plen_102_part_00
MFRWLGPYESRYVKSQSLCLPLLCQICQVPFLWIFGPVYFVFATIAHLLFGAYMSDFSSVGASGANPTMLHHTLVKNHSITDFTMEPEFCGRTANQYMTRL